MARDEQKHAGRRASTPAAARQERLATLQREKARLEEGLVAVEREIESVMTQLNVGKPPEGESVADPGDSLDQGPADHPGKEAAGRAADRSTWSPKLRERIEKRFPKETREERVRRVREKPFPRFNVTGIPADKLRYFAEDVDFEYDV